MTTREVLRKAARLIEKYGLRKGDYGSRRLGFCITGALSEVVRPSDLNDDTFIRARQAVQLAIGGEFLVDWNDATGRTKAEVLAALRKAAR